MIRFFVTGTGTGVGKTWVTRGLTCAYRRAGRRVAALKPYETGCEPRALDAEALAAACGRPELATAPGLYRAAPPLAPYAATLAGESPPPPIEAMAETLEGLAADADVLLVEGAGGLLVPLDPQHTIAELAQRLAAPLLVVARDGLGVLSHTLALVEAARARHLTIAAVVLVATESSTSADPSPASNGAILEERLAVPVVPFAVCEDDDERLADAAADLVAAL